MIFDGHEFRAGPCKTLPEIGVFGRDQFFVKPADDGQERAAEDARMDE